MTTKRISWEPKWLSTWLCKQSTFAVDPPHVAFGLPEPDEKRSALAHESAFSAFAPRQHKTSPTKPGIWQKYWEEFMEEWRSVVDIAAEPPAVGNDSTKKRARSVSEGVVVDHLMTALLAGCPLSLARLQAYAPSVAMWRRLDRAAADLGIKSLAEMSQHEYLALMARAQLDLKHDRIKYLVWKRLKTVGYEGPSITPPAAASTPAFEAHVVAPSCS